MEIDQEKSIRDAESTVTKTIQEMEAGGHSRLKIAQELAIIAYSDIKNHVTIDEGGAIQAIRLEGMGDHSRAVKKIKENTKITESADGERLFKDSKIEYELYDKLDALKFAASLMGMVQPQKHEVDVKGPLQINLIDRFGEKKDGPAV